MRPIKFRGWNEKNKRWLYGDYVTGVYIDPEYNSPSVSHFISTKEGDDPKNPTKEKVSLEMYHKRSQIKKMAENFSYNRVMAEAIAYKKNETK